MHSNSNLYKKISGPILGLDVFISINFVHTLENWFNCILLIYLQFFALVSLLSLVASLLHLCWVQSFVGWQERLSLSCVCLLWYFDFPTFILFSLFSLLYVLSDFFQSSNIKYWLMLNILHQIRLALPFFSYLPSLFFSLVLKMY